MTEVRKSSFGSLGFFATKSYDSGERIIEESPLVKLSPLSKAESKELMENFIGSKKAEQTLNEPPTLWNSIDVPSSVPAGFHGTFRGMIQLSLCWMNRQPIQTKDDILKLYYPSENTANSFEKKLIQVTEEALKYMKANKPEKYANFEDWKTLETVMLIWGCNSFQGGRIYGKLSRVNHSCNPNAVILPFGESQRLVAASDIAQGDEITISYLGLLLYTETTVRRAWLQKSKFFECTCKRCSTTEEDKAARIPCPTRHPRQGSQQSLDEDVQYDDDQTVQYTSKLSQESHDKLLRIMGHVTKKVVSYLETVDYSEKGDDAKDKDSQNDEEILEGHISLSRAILGDKHWATNLLLLLYLDHRLSTITQVMLTTQENPEMEDVAEVIDGLQRVCRFVDYLDLKLAAGHVLGDVIIGVSRTLVSFGDLKSQKYGAEWLDQIIDYVDEFESEGRQKVVGALRTAWMKHDREATDGNGGQATKRAKIN